MEGRDRERWGNCSDIGIVTYVVWSRATRTTSSCVMWIWLTGYIHIQLVLSVAS